MNNVEKKEKDDECKKECCGKCILKLAAIFLFPAAIIAVYATLPCWAFEKITNVVCAVTYMICFMMICITEIVAFALIIVKSKTKNESCNCYEAAITKMLCCEENKRKVKETITSETAQNSAGDGKNETK